MTFLLVGLASGLASATLSISLLSGSMLAVLLFMFAPLPILIASIGWNHRAGLVGVAVACVALFALTGFATARGYAVSIGLPAWWLGYLALLARPAGDTPEAGMDWYPVGRLVVWSAALGAGLIVLTILLSGSISAYRDVLRATFDTFLRQEAGTPAGAPIELPGGGDAARLADLAVMALPPVGAALWTANTLFNLWLAGRISRASDRLTRPWPDLAALELPPLALMVFAVALLGAFIPGFGFVLGVVAAAFGIAFALLGLAFLHASTRGVNGRTLMLATTYILLAVQTWTVIVLAVLGILEQVFGMRARAAARRGPPTPPAHR